MFKNISFLFLFAMALFSWAVLCLQHAVEIQKRSTSDYRVEFYTERPGITFEPHVFHNPSGTLSGAFDFTMSFWVILALTFGLSKLALLAERQAKYYLKSRQALNLNRDPAAEQKLPPSQQKEETKDPAAMEENTALGEQLSVLQTHCLEMRELLHDLRVSKSCSSQESVEFGDEVAVEHSDEPMMARKGSSTAESESASMQILYRNPESFTLMTGSSQHSQNIYITNSHIHIGGPVFCSDTNFSMELCRQASMYSRKQSEFLQVWGKYITGPKEGPMIAAMHCNDVLL
ncbi:uncharacterized protein LOC110185086 [Drosophila serrata]|uniref:uncharacterized protein LOC110185086 n=1 Tax=Drosophila serrata TaxID=7274 RepID=UPI000A1D343C|nr:uncharacterized protein LOC110185086 [Drosophila serrata]KAH8356935.1 hypothetical protein KR200_005216 [Drosophila serrata]